MAQVIGPGPENDDIDGLPLPRRTRLYVLHKLPTPYNDDLFRALHAAEDIELQVYHLWKGSERRPWRKPLATGYPNIFMTPRLGIDWGSLSRAWHDTESVFMVGDWAHLPPVALIFARLARGAPVALWVDTPQEQLPRPFLKRVLRARFLRWLLNRVDVTFGSGIPAARALAQMGAPSQSVVDLQFAVDLDRPSAAVATPKALARAKALRESVGCGDDGTVFVMSGTIDLTKKAQDLGLRAVARAAERAQRPIGVLVAGAGVDLEALKSLATDLKLGNRVQFLGWLEPDEVDAVYLASDALLHPAHYDPFPLVVIEAMSFSLPVVGSDQCGSVEQRVSDGVNGYIFPAGNVDACADAILKVSSDAHHLADLKRAARQTGETWPMSRSVEVIRQSMARMLKARGQL